jgi:hypothetical protein
MPELDHFMYAVSSLEDGIAWAQEIFQVTPDLGGAHPGQGTQNALISLGDSYLEIIAPDPKQSLEGNLGGRLSQLAAPGLVTWVLRGELESIKTQCAPHALKMIGPFDTQRQTPDAQLLQWQLLFARNAQFSGCMPFFIDWLACPHPSRTNVVGGEFVSLDVFHPQAEAMNAVMADIGGPITVQAGEARLQLNIKTKLGNQAVQSTATTLGLTFG